MPVKSRRKKIIGKAPADKVETGSGNVFSDMGSPQAEERLAKAELAHQLGLLIKDAGLSQKQAAMRLGIDQPKVSALIRGNLKDFSTERLMRFITLMDHDVVISIHNPRAEKRATLRVLARA